MNINKLIDLRDFLKALPEFAFGHNKWGIGRPCMAADADMLVTSMNVCGTVACIAGWACMKENLAEPHYHEVSVERKTYKVLRHFYGDTRQESQDFYSLTDAQAIALFLPIEVDDIDRDELCEGERAYIDSLMDEDDDFHLDEYLSLETTSLAHAVAYLDLMISEERTDIRWWKQIKEAL